MSHFICPVCFRHAPISTFDPDGFNEDLTIISYKGLGYGRGFGPASKESALGLEEYGWLMDALATRVSNVFYFFNEEETEEEDKLLAEINNELRETYPDGFTDFNEATRALLELYQDIAEETEDEDQEEFEDDDNNDNESLSNLEKELRLGD